MTGIPYKAISDGSRRTIVVGDIHGCWDEFRQLLSAMEFGDGDVIISVGDFLDRGPGSWAVAKFLRDTPNAFSVLGNHERRVAGVVRGRSQPAWSQKQTLSLIPEGEWPGWAGWLESLPAVIEAPQVIVTHARLDPARQLTDQDSHFTAAVGGTAVTIDKDVDGVPLWYRKLSAHKPICMGHIGYDRVALVPGGLYALDTRAVHGGQLTGVVFPGGGLFQVTVSRDYHKDALKSWRSAQVALAGSPTSWPLVKVVKTLDTRGEDTADEEAYIAELERAIAALGIEERGRVMRAILKQRFGDLPPAGPKRGEYFKNMKRTFADWGLQSLARRLYMTA